MQGGSKMFSIRLDTRIVSPCVDSSYRKSICARLTKFSFPGPCMVGWKCCRFDSIQLFCFWTGHASSHKGWWETGNKNRIGWFLSWDPHHYSLDMEDIASVSVSHHHLWELACPVLARNSPAIKKMKKPSRMIPRRVCRKKNYSTNLFHTLSHY